MSTTSSHEPSPDNAPSVRKAPALLRELHANNPSWRGWIHASAVPLAMILGIVLIIVARGPAAKTGASIFFASSLLLFGVSALYHRVPWSDRAHAILRRIDHANIYLLIAGTYTPMALLCLPRTKAILLLSIVWAGAALGIGFRVFWLNAPRWLYVALYLVLGWAALVFIVDFFHASWIAMSMILLGGIFYTLGATAYGLKRPNPFPKSFGFHEVFHACTLLAFISQWLGILIVSTNPPLA